MKITVYTITDCPFSKQEKDYLASHNLQYEEKNLETNKDFLTEMLAVSNNFAGTPVTKIEKDDGQITVLKGFTQSEFDQALGLASVAAPAPALHADAPVPSAPTPPAPVPTPPPAPEPPHVDQPDSPPPVQEPVHEQPPASAPQSTADDLQKIVSNMSAQLNGQTDNSSGPQPTAPEPPPAPPSPTEPPMPPIQSPPPPATEPVTPTQSPLPPVQEPSAPQEPQTATLATPSMPALSDLASVPNPTQTDKLNSILENLQSKVQTSGTATPPTVTPTVPSTPTMPSLPDFH